MTHRMLCLALGSLTMVALLAAPASAAPIVLGLDQEDFTNLGVVGPASALVVSGYNYNNTFTGQVISQAFELNDGNYLYLYQADNYGPSVLEVFALSPFYGVDTNRAGYLTANEPTGFLPTATGLAPAGASYDALLYPVVSYNYPSFMGAHVPPGQHTAGLYLVSPNAPTLGEGYVIDSGTAVVDVVIPTPEPAAASLMLIGGVAVLIRSRRKV